MTATSDVIVIGAGVVGAACARALALTGARVAILRRTADGEAWRAAAGMLAAQVEAGPDDPLFNLAVAGRAFYAREADRLRDTTGVDIGLAQTGVLHVAYTDAQVTSFKAKVAWQRQQAQRADWLESDEIRDSWPFLAPGLGGLWASEDGSLDPSALVEALLADAIRLGAHLVDDTAVAIDRTGEQLHGVIGAAGRYAASQVIIAGGAWGGRLDNLPRPLSVEPVRGQMLAVDWPAGAPAIVAYGDRCYILRRGEEMLVGSTMEHAGFDATTTEPGIAELLSRATALYPALATATIHRRWAGLRPGTPDGVPIIGPEPRLPGLWYAAGHGRNGVLLAGITGEMLAQAIAGEPLPDDLRAARPTRFWSW